MTAPLLTWVALLFLVVGLLARRPLLAGAGLLVLLTGGLVQLWRAWGGRNLYYRRRLVPNRVFPGETVRLSIQVENDKLLPLSWLIIEDEVPQNARWASGHLRPGNSYRRPALIQSMTVGWFQRVTRHYTLQLPRRGVYPFGPATAALGDPFGLEQQSLPLAQFDHLIVYPALMPLPPLDAPPGRPGDTWARPGSLVEDPARFRGVRPYQAGDSLRRVHWGATARLGALQVKELEPAIDDAACILLDVRLRPATRETAPLDWQEWAISAAASLYLRELARGRRVALYGNGYSPGRGPAPSLPPTRHPSAGAAALEALARMTAGPTFPFEQLALRATGRLAPGTALLVVTSREPQQLWPCLLDCRRKGFPVHLICLTDRPVPVMRAGIRVSVLRPPQQEAGSNVT